MKNLILDRKRLGLENNEKITHILLTKINFHPNDKNRYTSVPMKSKIYEHNLADGSFLKNVKIIPDKRYVLGVCTHSNNARPVLRIFIDVFLLNGEKEFEIVMYMKNKMKFDANFRQITTYGVTV